MKPIHAILALCIGLTAGIGLTVTLPAVAETLSVELAKEQARANANAAMQKTPYVKDNVTLYGVTVYILEDHKRNRLCYIPTDYDGYTNSVAGMSCGPLDRRVPR
jgi:hypothetical protein